MVNKRVHFEQIATVLSIPVEEIQLLNPQYKRGIVPGDIKPYAICLPLNYANQFIDKQDEILAYNTDTFNTRRAEIAPDFETKSAVKRSNNTSKKTSESLYTTHVVKKGQTLGGIARKYHVTIAQIKKWNNLKKSEVKQGQTLKIRKK